MPQGPAVRSRAGGCSSQRCRQLQTSCTLGITWASCSHLTQWPATLQDLESNQNKARHSTGDKECSPSRCGARAPWQAEGPTGLPGMASGSTGGTRGAGRAPRAGPGLTLLGWAVGHTKVTQSLSATSNPSLFQLIPLPSAQTTRTLELWEESRRAPAPDLAARPGASRTQHTGAAGPRPPRHRRLRAEGGCFLGACHRSRGLGRRLVQVCCSGGRGVQSRRGCHASCWGLRSRRPPKSGVSDGG